MRRWHRDAPPAFVAWYDDRAAALDRLIHIRSKFIRIKLQGDPHYVDRRSQDPHPGLHVDALVPDDHTCRYGRAGHDHAVLPVDPASCTGRRWTCLLGWRNHAP